MTPALDLTTYPLDQPESAAYRLLRDRARADLNRYGLFDLPGLMRAEALARAVQQVGPLIAAHGFRHARRHNIYFRPEVPGLPADHPALQTHETVNHTVCTDQLAGTLVRELYEWRPLAGFLADVMQLPRLYTMADPLAGVNAMAYSEGEALNWHFDRSEFTTTLLLQAPEAGGVFEYRTDLRTEDDPNFDGVARLVTGRDPDVECHEPQPGTLSVFRGRNTAHRVTPVRGSRSRIIAVFSYFDRPGVAFTAAERRGFYGRDGAAPPAGG